MSLEKVFGEDKGSQKITYFLIGFFTIIFIFFSFQYLGEKIPGLKENYESVFCTGIK